MGRALALVLGAVWSWSLVVSAGQQPASPRPQFEARAELVLVDVAVVDGDSRPVADLRPEEFELQVNGAARTIASAQFISGTPPPATAPARALDQQYSTNEAATTGRLLLFAIDESHLRVGSSTVVLRTAEMLLSQLAPGDLVGVARMPTGVGSVEFTADRDRVRQALNRLTGTAGGAGGREAVRISEAFALESNDQDTWRMAVERECAALSDMSRESCADALEADARMLIAEARRRAQTTIRYLETMFERLATLKTPVNVVMISEGMFVARESPNMAALARRAAEARATLHIVRPAPDMVSDIMRQSSSGARSTFFDDGLVREGLEQLAGQTRGRLLQVGAGTGAGIFERLSRELSGYYLLGFEPTDADRAARDRRIRVQVRRKGLTVRARPTFALVDAAAARAELRAPAEVIKDLLTAPLPDRGLPIRLATYTTSDVKDPRLRIVISAEIGDAAQEAAETQVGVLVLDQDDKVAASSSGPMQLSPASALTPSPRLMQTTVLLEPGEYTLRLAAIDANGRAGSAHHSIKARLTKLDGRREASDLLVAPQPDARQNARIPATGLVDTEGVSMQIEVSGPDEPLLAATSVAVQVAESATGPALASGGLPLVSRTATTRIYGGILRLGLLPPGDYLARAVVTAPDHDEGRVVRAFRYAPAVGLTRNTEPAPDASTPSPDLLPDEVVIPPPPPRIVVRLPGFEPARALESGVVNAFLDSLAELHPPSAAIAPVLERARSGTFEAPDPRRDAPTDDEVTLAFVRGLAELKKKRLPAATAWFQVALRDASDFLGAAYYLGVCQAAQGRDADAVGAWTLALLSNESDLVYPALVDALLRTGDALQALAYLDEAPDAWPDVDIRDERQATAEAMTGSYAPAIERLHALIERRPADNDLLYLALQVMYRIRQESGSIGEADRGHFVDYARRYSAAKGPQAALVATWLRFVEKK